MKVLIVEDTVIKFIDIKRALTEICRDIEIVHVRSLNSAKNILDEAIKVSGSGRRSDWHGAIQ